MEHNGQVELVRKPLGFLASHASELPAVADSAGFLIELCVSAVVRIEEIRRMIGRLERLALGVALIASASAVLLRLYV